MHSKFTLTWGAGARGVGVCRVVAGLFVALAMGACDGAVNALPDGFAPGDDDDTGLPWDPDGPDDVAGYPVSVDEAAMRAVVRDGDVTVTVPLTLSRGTTATGRVTLTVVRLSASGDTTDVSRSTTFDFAKNSEPKLTLSVAGVNDAKGTASYVIAYDVKTNVEGAVAARGTRSLFDIVEKTRTLALGNDKLFAGGVTLLRLIVSDPKTGKPRANTTVAVTLVAGDREEQLFSGITDDFGFINPNVATPDDLSGSATLKIQIADGGDTILQPVSIVREAKVLLTTDKPLYQPGQTMHLRVLALKRPALRPAAGAQARFEVLDGKGNKVFKREVTLNDYGVAGATFAIASVVNTGKYTVRAVVDDTTTEKTVTVDRYVLPKFNVVTTAERPYYKPGDLLRATVDARYFFGKPVADATVTVAAYRSDVEVEKFNEVSGKTNAEGLYTFSFELPTFFAGTPLDQGNASVLLEVKVVDPAGQTFTNVKTITVAGADLVALMFSEQAEIVPGIANRFFISVTDPIGNPIVGAGFTVGVDGLEVASGSTDAFGLADFTYAPPGTQFVAALSAVGAGGASVERETSFSAGTAGVEAILLRTDKAIYKVGESIDARILASGGRTGRVFVDVIRAGQTAAMLALDLEAGEAQTTIDVSADLAGPITLFAYQIGESGNLIRASRLIFVRGANDLALSATLDKSIYKPAEEAKIDFEVKGPDGSGVQSALGVYIVDEAVYALTENRPGLEKLFFLIEGEIAEPRIQVQGFSNSDYVNPSDDTERDERAGEVLAASAEPLAGYPLNVDTYAGLEQSAVSTLTARVKADVTAMIDLLGVYAKQGVLTYENADVLVPGYLADYTDPFGRRYRVAVESASYQLVVESDGADETRGTTDDLKVTDSLYRAFYDSEWDDDDAFPGDGGGFDDDDFAADDDDATEAPGNDDDSNGGGDAGPRVRKFFPETLLAEPAIITDESGKATLTVPLADSITTWRMSALASSSTGAIGSMEKGITVFQDFFVDLDLPSAITRNDTFSVPVAVFNYLETPQDVTLTLKQEPWFALDDAAVKAVSLAPGAVASVSFKVRALEVGTHAFQVTGEAQGGADAVRRNVRVTPDGDPVIANFSGALDGKIDHEVSFPAGVVPGANELVLKIYPGLLSQAVDGLDAILRYPDGCFEQTSSTSYPNALVLNYLRTTGQVNPEVEAKALEFIALGYQRLVTFEVAGGGFEWFGNDPAHTILTAYGLQFSDTRKVYDIDDAVITRTQAWLASKQKPAGSWVPDAGGIAEGAINNFQSSALRNTAYVVWALLESGYADTAVIESGLTYLRQNQSGTIDTYTRALLANAFVAADPTSADADAALAKLDEAKQTDDKGRVYWTSEEPSETFSTGGGLTLETTALAAYAMLRASAYTDVATSAIDYLAGSKDSFGNWETTQGTIYALKAMIEAASLRGGDEGGTVKIKVNGNTVADLTIAADEADIVRLFDLTGEADAAVNTVTLEESGDGRFFYQLVATHYVPWATGGAPAESDVLAIDVAYDRTSLAVDETALATVTITNRVEAEARMVLVDLGIPAGFSLVAEDLEAYTGTLIQRYEVAPRQLIVYLYGVPASGVVTFSYRVRADMPLKSTAPRSAAYPYYTPEERAETAPVEFVVSAGN